MTESLDHDAYIAAAAEALRPQLAVVRDRLKQALPDAEQVMQYGMPGFLSGSVMIAGYGAFSKQCCLYVSKRAVSRWSDRSQKVSAPCSPSFAQRQSSHLCKCWRTAMRFVLVIAADLISPTVQADAVDQFAAARSVFGTLDPAAIIDGINSGPWSGPQAPTQRWANLTAARSASQNACEAPYSTLSQSRPCRAHSLVVMR